MLRHQTIVHGRSSRKSSYTAMANSANSLPFTDDFTNTNITNLQESRPIVADGRNMFSEGDSLLEDATRQGKQHDNSGTDLNIENIITNIGEESIQETSSAYFQLGDSVSAPFLQSTKSEELNTSVNE